MLRAVATTVLALAICAGTSVLFVGVVAVWAKRRRALRSWLDSHSRSGDEPGSTAKART